MKKLLVLALVLGVAGLASAALSLTVDGVVPTEPIEIMPSDTLAIGFTQDLGAASEGYIIMTDGLDFGEWLQGQEATYGSPEYAWQYYGTAVDPSMDAYFLGLEGADTTEYQGIMGEVMFHCVAEGPVEVTLFDANFTPVDSIVIQQVPEPMTMALLGIGGLFLRRRK